MKERNESPGFPMLLSKLPMNFPNPSNYLIRNYDLFNIEEIASNKFHLAFDILQSHLGYLIETWNQKTTNESLIFNQILYQLREEENDFLNQLITLIEILISEQNDENELLIKKKLIIQGNIENTKSLLKSINIQI